MAGGANLYPAMFRGLVDAFARGDVADAAVIQAAIAGLGHDIFSITGQPSSVFAAIKGALAALGLCRPDMLPPLSTCSPADLAALRRVLDGAFHPSCAVA